MIMQMGFWFIWALQFPKFRKSIFCPVLCMPHSPIPYSKHYRISPQFMLGMCNVIVHMIKYPPLFFFPIRR